MVQQHYFKGFVPTGEGAVERFSKGHQIQKHFIYSGGVLRLLVA